MENRYYFEDYSVMEDYFDIDKFEKEYGFEDFSDYPEFDDYDMACLTDDLEVFEEYAYEYEEIELPMYRMAA